MFISISDKFLGKTRALAGDQRFHSAIGNLLLAFKEGKHVLWASRGVLKELGEEFPSQKGVLKLVEKKTQDSAALLEKVLYYVELLPEQVGDPERVEEHGRVRYGLPYGWFEDSLNVQPTVLIGEHTRDITVYQAAANGFLRAEKIGVKLCLEARSGHGGNCADSVKENRGKRLLLCIVDSDRTWPAAPVGQTAKDARDALSQKEPAEVFVLPCHELENLLPEQLLERALDGSDNDAARLKRLLPHFKRLGILGALGDYGFLNLKAGLTRKQVFAVRAEDERTFLADLAPRLQAKLTDHGAPWCTTRCESPDACKCVIYERWVVLKHVVEYLQQTDKPADLARLFHQPGGTSQAAWRDVSLRVVSWGCAYPRVAT